MRTCETVNPEAAAARMRRNQPATRGGKRRCGQCDGLGHNMRTCPELHPEKHVPMPKRHRRRRCTACDKVGHNSRTCPTIHGVRPRKRRSKGPRICSACNEVGHNSRTCPTLNPDAAAARAHRNSVKGSRSCSKCGKKGHNSRTCKA